METQRRALFHALLGLIVLAVALPGGLSMAQTPEPTSAWLVPAPDLDADQHALLADLAARLPAQMRDAAALDPANLPADAPLVITAEPCTTDDCALRLRFFVTAGPERPLFTPELQRELTNSAPLMVYLAGAPADSAVAALHSVTTALLAAGRADCPAALAAFAALDAAAMPPADHTFALTLHEAICLHHSRDYNGALALLTGPARTALFLTPAARPLRPLWDATLADAYAQNFDFDRALRWDTRTLDRLRALPGEDAALYDRIAPELLLLRGQHRLYLYEWDAVLADYNAALAFPTVPARAYYYRGLLYAIQDQRQAALDDLQTYLALAPDPASPLIPLATEYAAEMRLLLDAAAPQE